MKHFKFCITTSDSREVLEVQSASVVAVKEHAESLIKMYDVPTTIGVFEQSANGMYDDDLREVENGNWSFVCQVSK